MPRKPGNKQLQVEVTPETSDLVGQAAGKRNMARSEWIREAIYEKLEREGFETGEKIAGRGKYPREQKQK